VRLGSEQCFVLSFLFLSFIARYSETAEQKALCIRFSLSSLSLMKAMEAPARQSSLAIPLRSHLPNAVSLLPTLCSAFKMSNPYRILEINASATSEDIRRAYRKLALRYHPDKNCDNPEKAHAAMVEVNTAYEQLTKRLPESSASTSTPRAHARREGGERSRYSSHRGQTPPTKPPAQPQCSKLKLEELEKDLADILPTLSTLEERTQSLIQFFSNRVSLFQAWNIIHRDLLDLRTRIRRARDNHEWLSVKLSGFTQLPDEHHLAPLHANLMNLKKGVQYLASRTRLLRGIVACLDDWVEAFEKGKKSDRDEFAKMLASSQKMLGKDEFWNFKE
jgi:DnaJ-domain-containing protein 1